MKNPESTEGWPSDAVITPSSFGTLYTTASTAMATKSSAR
jgi:hypothetical protein